MGLTSNQDAFDVNTLLRYILKIRQHGELVGEGEAVDAAARLANASFRKIAAGLSGGDVLEAWGPIAPPCDDHDEVQHRDMNGPWCEACGWRRGVIGRLRALQVKQIEAATDG